jgi:galactokinase
MKAYCIRVGTKYVSGANGFGGCVPKLVSNKNFAYVYDTRAEAEAAVRHLAVAQITWDAQIEKL